MASVTVYGIGGYDPTKPNNNIIEEYEIEPTPEMLEYERIETLKQSARTKLIAGQPLTEEEVDAILP